MANLFYGGKLCKPSSYFMYALLYFGVRRGRKNPLRSWSARFHETVNESMKSSQNKNEPLWSGDSYKSEVVPLETSPDPPAAEKANSALMLSNSLVDHPSPAKNVVQFNAIAREQIAFAIIEDEPALLNLYSHVLNKHGFKVTIVAENGDEIRNGMEKKLGEIDIAIIDYRLGSDMNGIDVARTILRINPKTEIIIATAEESIESEVQGWGFIFLKKPFSKSDMLKCVSLALAREKD